MPLVEDTRFELVCCSACKADDHSVAVPTPINKAQGFLLATKKSFKFAVCAFNVELPVGFEPTTSCLQGRCSTVEPEKHNWCPIRDLNPEKVTGFGPAASAVPPTGHISDDAVATCLSATCFHVRHSNDVIPTSVRLSSVSGTPYRTRTCNLRFRRPLHIQLC